MSLAIDVTRVVSVLLADGWHEVKKGTFVLDAYEYGVSTEEGFDLLHGGGRAGVCSTGFQFVTSQDDRLVEMSGPLTAILAVASTSDEPG